MRAHQLVKLEKNFIMDMVYQIDKGTDLLDILYGIDMEDPDHPKRTDNEEDALKPEYITKFVKNLITKCKGMSLDFTKENISLVRYGLKYAMEKIPQKFMNKAQALPDFGNENFVNQISVFIQEQLNRIKGSEDPKDQENYNLLSIFKSALKLTDEDIKRLEEIENSKKPLEN